MTVPGSSHKYTRTYFRVHEKQVTKKVVIFHSFCIVQLSQPAVLKSRMSWLHCTSSTSVAHCVVLPRPFITGMCVFVE